MKLSFEAYKSANGWRIRATHKNGNILFVSGESYRRKFDANRMLANFLLAIQNGEFKVDKDEMKQLRPRPAKPESLPLKSTMRNP